MKVFWSWQADTPGKTGRHFVRDALSEAIDALNADKDIIEPSEREGRDALELDHDRQGVSGSPDLAATIFRKIDETAVFIADVTAVGTTGAAKKLINSNVAIEYGHAHHSIGDTSILMVQNTHYGNRDDLPFDLRHKAGPIQYMLAPNASKAEIAAEQVKLKGAFIVALRPFLKSKPVAQRPLHQEVPSTYIKAAFAQPHEVIARIGTGTNDEIEYRFGEPRAFYLRLIPYYARTTLLSHADLGDLARNRAIDLLLRERYTGYGARNHLGAILFEPHGTATTTRALTQVFPNGEIWGLTTEMFAHWQGTDLIPTINVKNIFSRVLENFLSLSEQQFGNGFPVAIIFGAVGLAGYRLPLDQNQYNFSGAIHQNELEVRLRLNDETSDTQEQAVETFLSQLFDLAGERRR
jgi:hypothetical protein